ncbi:nucleotidyltransferase family protein [Candidatus Pacearchaeota archaeon]|nr:nucleotidyltransferase family protein [Candidatus Pacearchaeota archaeon]
MKAVILCAGFATRLYPLTLDKPKSLLEISGKPLLNYIVEKIEKINEINEISIVTNEKFLSQFEKWLQENTKKFEKKIKIINDGTKTNETRLGGIGDLDFAIKKEKINEDLLVVLGDNLFDFDLISFLEFFKKKNEVCIGVYDLKNKEKVRQLGVLEIKNQKLISFEEKPQNPKSTIISTGIYFFPGKNLKKISDYMKTDKPKDGPGYLILNLLNSQDIHVFEFRGKWFDIGTKEIYEKVKDMIF